MGMMSVNAFNGIVSVGGRSSGGGGMPEPGTVICGDCRARLAALDAETPLFTEKEAM